MKYYSTTLKQKLSPNRLMREWGMIFLIFDTVYAALKILDLTSLWPMWWVGKTQG